MGFPELGSPSNVPLKFLSFFSGRPGFVLKVAYKYIGKDTGVQRMGKLTVFLGALLISYQAHAGFLGNTLDADYLFPTDGTVFDPMSNQVVRAGPEWNVQNFSIDVSDTMITLSRASPINFISGSFNGLSFTDIFGTIASIISVTVDASTTIAGFDNSRVSFDSDSIFLNFESLNDSPNFFAKVNVEFGSVPEPTTLALLGLGLVGAGFAKRRIH